MQEVIIIGSVHKEIGIASASELYKLLLDIMPEVIFEELHQSEFNQIYNVGAEGGLESKAVKMYMNNHPVKNIPVDLDRNSLITSNDKEEIQKTFNTFKTNKEYEFLLEIQQGQTASFGFPYLNSIPHKKLMSDMKLFEARMVHSINNESMSRAYTLWLDANKKRELAMLANIYSTPLKFKKSVLLVGAEHLTPIQEEVSNFKESSKNNLKWNFDYFENSSHVR